MRHKGLLNNNKSMFEMLCKFIIKTFWPPPLQLALTVTTSLLHATLFMQGFSFPRFVLLITRIGLVLRLPCIEP